MEKILYKKSPVYQVEFEGKYGYLQEIGEWRKDGKIAFCVKAYEQVFSTPVRQLSCFKKANFYLAHFDDNLEKEVAQNAYSYQQFNLPLGEVVYGGFLDNAGIYHRKTAKVTKLGILEIEQDIEIPDYVRTIENYKWIVKTPQWEYVRTQASCNGIENLPPYFCCIQNTVIKWLGNFKFSEWNDDYIKELKRINEESEVQEIIAGDELLSKWVGDAENEKEKSFYLKIGKICKNLRETLSNTTSLKKATKSVEKATISINKVQTESTFLETEKREQLLAYLSQLLADNDFSELYDIIDEKRDW